MVKIINSLFAVLGDTHIVNEDYLTTRYLKSNIDVLRKVKALKYVLVTGDIAHNALSSQYEIAKRLLDSLDTQYFCCAGNHDGVDLPGYRMYFGCEEYIERMDDFDLLVVSMQNKAKPFLFNLEKDKSILLTHDAEAPALKESIKKHGVQVVFQGHYHVPPFKDRVVDGVRFVTCPAYSVGVGRLSDPLTFNFIEGYDG